MEDKTTKIIEMRKNGKTYTTIQKALKVSSKKVSKLCKGLSGKNKTGNTINNSSQAETAIPKENVSKPVKAVSDNEAAYKLKILEQKHEKWVIRFEYKENEKIRNFENMKQLLLEAQSEITEKDEIISKQAQNIEVLNFKILITEDKFKDTERSCERLNDDIRILKADLKESEKNSDKWEKQCDELTDKLERTEYKFEDYKKTHQ